MMGISHLLECFDEAHGASRHSISLSEDGLEDQKLEAFENGYKAGWDDAASAQASDQKRISSDFEQNLQQLSFTYHEAYAQILKSLKPLFQEMFEKLVPGVAQTSLGVHVLHEINELAGKVADQDIEIVVCPTNALSLEGILENADLSSVHVQVEPTLGDGQAFVRFAQSEKQINLEEVFQGLSQAMDGFFKELDQTNSKEIGNAG